MDKQLERVGLNLNQAVIAFWQARVGQAVQDKRRFTGNELRAYVNRHNFGTAPGSADRILRLLKKKKIINYVLVNRSLSLYEAIPVQ